MKCPVYEIDEQGHLRKDGLVQTCPYKSTAPDPHCGMRCPGFCIMEEHVLFINCPIGETIKNENTHRTGIIFLLSNEYWPKIVKAREKYNE